MYADSLFPLNEPRTFAAWRAEIAAQGKPVTGFHGGVTPTLVQLLDDPVSEHVESLYLGGGTSGAACDAMFDSARFRTLRALDVRYDMSKKALKRLLQGVAFERLEALTLQSDHLDDAALALLAANPCFATVRSLALFNAKVTAKGVAHLAASKHLTGLRALSLQSCTVSLGDLTPLLSGPATPHLEEVAVQYLPGDPLDDFAGLTGPVRLRSLDVQCEGRVRGILPAIARCRALSDLRALRVVGTWGTQAEAAVFAKNEVVTKIESLTLGFGATGKALAALLGGPALGALRELALHYIPLGDEGMTAMAESPALAGLASLTMSNCRVGEAGTRALAASPHLGALRVLDWDEVRAGDVLATAVATGALRGIETLRINRAKVGDEGAAALGRATSLPKIRELSLFSNDIGPEGARGLVAGDALRDLTRLELLGCEIGRSGVEALVAGDHFRALEYLGLECCELPDETVAMLKKHPRYGAVIKV